MWLKALGFFLLSSVKFAVAALPIAVAFNYQEALFISISGGIAGAFFFLYIWKYILEVWNIHIVKKVEKPILKVKVNKKKRQIIKLKNSYGYWGIVILTPVILSIPVGAFILSQYYKNEKLKFLHLSVVVSIWGVFLISFFEFFYDQFF